MTQKTLRTNVISPNKNINFPIGTILAVQKYYKKLKFSKVFSEHKKRGRNINSLIKAIVSYKLTENFSISKASNWINRDEVLERFDLKNFEERTLFRLLDILGENKEKIIANIQDCIFDVYSFKHTNINMDWTSLVLYGNKATLGKHGYSRDHRPDKKQITLGITEIASPINVPVGLTVKEGNVNDMAHFKDTYKQIKERLKKSSLVTFDKGTNSKENLELILADKMKYLTAKKLNKSDDKRIKEFDKTKAELIDANRKVYGLKFTKPNSTDYFYFSEGLQKEQLEAKKRKAEKMFEEAKQIQNALDKNRGLPKKFRINNKLVDVTYSYQTKLGYNNNKILHYLKKNQIRMIFS